MCELKLKWNESSAIEDVPCTEDAVYRKIGETLSTVNIPNKLVAEINGCKAIFDVKARGSYVKNGVVKPSMFVVEVSNNINGLAPSDPKEYKDAYLTCINPESNNYKFYYMKPSSKGIDVTYGRIGSQKGEIFGEKSLQEPYPLRMFWIRYYEKLSKGYVDQSDIYLSKDKTTSAKNTVSRPAHKNEATESLYNLLQRYAKAVVEESLVNTVVTEAQVKEAKRLLLKLGERKTVKGFNTQLGKLLSISPRKARYIQDFYAKSTTEFASIIDREESLVNAMEAVAGHGSKKVVGTFLPDIEVYYATDKQKESVLDKLSDQLKCKVKNVYRVINQPHKERFDGYMKKYGIKKVKQLWHGSRNENWYSIFTNGLVLNPNAIITGKMFGQGIYFAPSSMKSWNYTSYRGTSWARGNSSTGIMGLYATAYGNPYDVTQACSYTQSFLDREGKNCIHAHAGSALLNDEIVYYHEAAVLLQYIVEFE